MGLKNSATEDYKILFPYFDFDFYRSSYGDINDPVSHYMENWKNTGFDPSPYFSTSFYLSAYKDVERSGVNPLLHYLKYGATERRRPFDLSSFADRYPGVNHLDAELSVLRWAMPCIFNDEKIENNPYGGFAELLDWLSETDASAVMLRRDSRDWVISFAGKGEHFFFLKKFFCFGGNLLLLRDKDHRYYCSGNDFPVIDKLSVYIDYLTGERVGKTLLIGQSYGGYCAMYQSTIIDKSVTFAFSPQAFHPTLAPYNVFFEPHIKKAHPVPAPDLVKKVANAGKGPRYVIAGTSEINHQKDYYWGDIISGSLLAATKNASLIVVDQDEHSTARYLDAEKFFAVIFDNFSMFMTDTNQSSLLIAGAGVYYPKKDQSV